MKLTKQQLIKVIKEELNAMLAEGDPTGEASVDVGPESTRISGVHIVPTGTGGPSTLPPWVPEQLDENGTRPAYSLSPDWATASQRDQLHTQDIVPDDMRIAAEYANWPQPDDLPYVDDEDALLRMHAWAPYLSALLGMPGDPRIAPARGGSIPDPAYGPGTPEEIERTGEAWGTAPDLPARSGVTLKPLEEAIEERLRSVLEQLSKTHKKSQESIKKQAANISDAQLQKLIDSGAMSGPEIDKLKKAIKKAKGEKPPVKKDAAPTKQKPPAKKTKPKEKAATIKGRADDAFSDLDEIKTSFKKFL